MKKIITNLLILFCFTTMLSQQMYRAEYKFTDKNNFTTKSYLYTDNKEATYKIYDNRLDGEEVVSKTGAVEFVFNDSLARFSYSNAVNSYYRFPYNKQELLYSDDLANKLNWKINNENKKKIGSYDCTEAKISLNGRDYTAWFTFEIPLKFGPLKFHKLPGMIVELREDNGWMKIELTTVSKTKETKNFISIKKYILSKKEIVNYEVYEKNLIKHEISFLSKFIAHKKNLPSGTTLEFDNQYTIDHFLDVPKDLLSEMNKIN